MSTAEVKTTPDLSGLDRLEHIRVAVAERKGGARWEHFGNGHWHLMRGTTLLATRRPDGAQTPFTWWGGPLDDNTAGVLLDELAAAGWRWTMWADENGAAAHAENPHALHRTQGSTRSETISLLYLLCTGHDVSELMNS